MRNYKYSPVVYNNGLFGIDSSLRNRIQQETMDCLERRRTYKKARRVSKSELIIKLSLVLSIFALLSALFIS